MFKFRHKKTKKY